MSNNIPEIRFKGFTHAWEQRTLGEVLAEKISNGIMNQPGRNSLNIKHINVVNLYSPSHIHLDELEYINVCENELKRCNVQKGDIFITRSSLKVEGIAQANILLDKGSLVFDDHIMRLRLNEQFEPFFVKESLNHSSIKKQFMTKAKTGTMTTIGQSDITSSIFLFPLLSEQTAIGNFFRTLDDTITLHKRKLDRLKDLKRGYLQQMFPQASENVPRVRFVGFNEPWQEQRLEEVAEIVSGGTPDTANPAYWNGNIEWFSPTQIGTETYASISQKKITELGLKNSSAKMLTGGRTILFTSRAGIGDMAILTRPAATNQGFQSLEIRKTFDVYFIYSMGSKIKEYALKNASGSTFLEISGKNLGRMKLYTPTLKEQTAIGNFFRNLDDQITYQKQKLSQLKQLKFAYLQKILI